jgi:hypothetical protein
MTAILKEQWTMAYGMLAESLTQKGSMGAQMTSKVSDVLIKLQKMLADPKPIPDTLVDRLLEQNIRYLESINTWNLLFDDRLKDL